MKFTEYTLLKEQSEQNGLSDEVRAYIDDQFKAIESRLSDISGSTKYNVLPAGEGLLQIIDIEKLAVAGQISFEGTMIGTPVVHGDKLSVGIQKESVGGGAEVLGLVFSLPGGENVGEFKVEQREDIKFKSTLGIDTSVKKEELDEQEIQFDEKIKTINDKIDALSDEIMQKVTQDVSTPLTTKFKEKETDVDQKFEKLKSDLAQSSAERVSDLEAKIGLKADATPAVDERI